MKNLTSRGKHFKPRHTLNTQRVKIDDKTYVEAPKTDDPQKVRELYQKNREPRKWLPTTSKP
jgi:hypothetical protein